MVNVFPVEAHSAEKPLRPEILLGMLDRDLKINRTQKKKKRFKKKFDIF
jgi:hypothetical protein